MSYGLTFYNNTGNVVIDAAYRNHLYWEHGTYSGSQHINTIELGSEIPITSNPIPFVKAPNDYVSVYGLRVNASGTAYDAILIASNSAQSIDWIVYAEQDTTSSGYGLDVFNEDGELVFTTNSPGYLNIKRSYSHGSTGASVDVDDADNDYFSVVGGAFSYTYSSNLCSRKIRGFKKTSSTTLYIDLFEYWYGAVTTGDVGSGGGSRSPNYFFAINPPPFLEV